jgi:polar amino acid transport system substrate-binding protein
MSKRSNRLFPAVLAAAVAAAFGAAPAKAQSEPACAALTITGHPSYPPVAWAEKGAIVGAAPALVSTIAGKLGVKNVTSKDFGSWDAAQAAARSGQADVIFGIYKTDARAQYLDYVEPPFMSDPVSVVVRKGAGFAFAEWSDLKNRKGVTNKGESYGDAFDGYMTKELTVVRAEGVDKAFASLVSGGADYMIIGLYPGRDEARKLKLTDKVEFLPKELTSAGMYVAFSKQSKCGALHAGFASGIKAAVDGGGMPPLLQAADKKLGY